MNVLTPMLAEIVHGDEVNVLTVTRVTVAIEAGKAAHLDTVEGKTLEFRCQGRDLVLTTICRGIYRRARRLCAFLLAQNPSRTVVGLACRRLLRGRRCVGRRPHHVDR